MKYYDIFGNFKEKNKEPNNKNVNIENFSDTINKFDYENNPNFSYDIIEGNKLGGNPIDTVEEYDLAKYNCDNSTTLFEKNCEGIEYNKSKREYVLKDDSSQKTSDSNFDSFLKKSNYFYEKVIQHNIGGDNLSNGPNNLEEAKDECNKNEDCMAFTVDNNNQSFLKDKNYEIIKNSSYTSYLKNKMYIISKPGVYDFNFNLLGPNVGSNELSIKKSGLNYLKLKIDKPFKTIIFEVWGAGVDTGNESNSSNGGYVKAKFKNSDKKDNMIFNLFLGEPGKKLIDGYELKSENDYEYIKGGGGFSSSHVVDNKNKFAWSGAGSSDIRYEGTDISNRILVAGGAGGSFFSYRDSSKDDHQEYPRNPHHGGRKGGSDIKLSNNQLSYVGDSKEISATDKRGGIGHKPDDSDKAGDGELFKGGDGLHSLDRKYSIGGGGGGGYYGGGASSYSNRKNHKNHAIGGGGGSSYLDKNYLDLISASMNKSNNADKTGHIRVIVLEDPLLISSYYFSGFIGIDPSINDNSRESKPILNYDSMTDDFENKENTSYYFKEKPYDSKNYHSEDGINIYSYPKNRMVVDGELNMNLIEDDEFSRLQDYICLTHTGYRINSEDCRKAAKNRKIDFYQWTDNAGFPGGCFQYMNENYHAIAHNPISDSKTNWEPNSDTFAHHRSLPLHPV